MTLSLLNYFAMDVFTIKPEPKDSVKGETVLTYRSCSLMKSLMDTFLPLICEIMSVMIFRCLDFIKESVKGQENQG